MNSARYKQFLKSRIPTAREAGGGDLIQCRCMYCSDSKDPSHSHFYISIPKDNKTPSLYYCHLCHNSGIVTYNKLIEWDLFDPDVAVDLIEHNKVAANYKDNIKYFDNRHYVMMLNNTSNTEISYIKLKYINDRLGTNFDFAELRKLKIALNLGDALRDNYITKLTRNENIVDQLDKNFIGFISIDNAFMNMRRLCDKGLVYKSIDKRYINYKIVDKYDTSERFYTIPTKINLLSTERIKIHVAEGPFDILSVYKNLRHEEPGIYTSIGGSNYKGIAMYFLEYYKLPFVEFHYYPDNDEFGSNKRMQNIAEYLKPMNFPMFVHRNTYENEKDFGVHFSRIKEAIQQL